MKNSGKAGTPATKKRGNTPIDESPAAKRLGLAAPEQDEDFASLSDGDSEQVRTDFYTPFNLKRDGVLVGYFVGIGEQTNKDGDAYKAARFVKPDGTRVCVGGYNVLKALETDEELGQKIYQLSYIRTVELKGGKTVVDVDIKFAPAKNPIDITTFR